MASVHPNRRWFLLGVLPDHLRRPGLAGGADPDPVRHLLVLPGVFRDQRRDARNDRRRGLGLQPARAAIGGGAVDAALRFRAAGGDRDALLPPGAVQLDHAPDADVDVVVCVRAAHGGDGRAVFLRGDHGQPGADAQPVSGEPGLRRRPAGRGARLRRRGGAARDCRRTHRDPRRRSARRFGGICVRPRRPAARAGRARAPWSLAAIRHGGVAVRRRHSRQHIAPARVQTDAREREHRVVRARAPRALELLFARDRARTGPGAAGALGAFTGLRQEPHRATGRAQHRRLGRDGDGSFRRDGTVDRFPSL